MLKSAQSCTRSFQRTAVLSQTSERKFKTITIVVCTIVMLVGAALRFSFLDGKIFGNDEATTALHVSGKTTADYAAAMFDGRPHTAQEISVFQKPDRSRGFAAVAQSLAVEDPQHPPLYYFLERQWELDAGSSIAARRALAAVFGTIAILAAFWLASEVASQLAGFISGALVAASPFAIAYSQVDREYSLWMVLTFASSALFLRAIARRDKIATIAYIVTCIAGLYTDTLFAIVLLAHCIALLFMSRDRRQSLVWYSVCLAVVTLAYVPWIGPLVSGFARGAITNNLYLNAALPLNLFALKWLFNIGTLFYDADYVFPRSAFVILPGLVALGAAFIACALNVRGKLSIGLLFALGGVALLAVVPPDLIHHEQRSTASRYLVPLWAACYTILGAGLAYFAHSSRAALRWSAFAFVLVTAGTGFGSFAVSAKHQTWWVDGSTASIGPIARAIAQVHNPVVVYHSTWGPGRRGPQVWNFAVAMLADTVNPATLFVQYRRDRPSAMPAVGGTLLLLDPDDKAIATLRAHGGHATEISLLGKLADAGTDVAKLRKAASQERNAGNGWSVKPSIWAVRLR